MHRISSRCRAYARLPCNANPKGIPDSQKSYLYLEASAPGSGITIAVTEATSQSEVWVLTEAGDGKEGRCWSRPNRLSKQFGSRLGDSILLFPYQVAGLMEKMSF